MDTSFSGSKSDFESNLEPQKQSTFPSPDSNEAANQGIHVRVVFALIIAAAFLDVVDFSIIQVALPTIRTDFIVSLADSQWVIGAYGLTLAGFLLLSGRAGDFYGQKRLFIIGVALFSVASLVGGFAPSLVFLVASRAIQGVGAAISTVTALAIFATIFPEGPRRNRAFGALVAVLSAGFAAGSITGGVLTAAFGWRSVMFVNVPIGLVAASLSVKYLPRTRGRGGPRGHLDLPGSLLVTGGTMLFVYALTNAATYGFADVNTLVPLGFSVLVSAGFVFVELRAKNPLMPIEFLRRGTILIVNIISLIVAAASGGLGFLLTIYLQSVLGYSALYTGLAFLPAALVFLVVGGWGSSWLINRLGIKRVLIISMSLVVLGNLLLTQISETGTYLATEPGMIFWALGASIGFPALFIAALTGIKPGEEGLASGVITTSQRVGFPLGLAILVAVASAVSPQPMGSGGVTSGIVLGFRYAFVAAAVLSFIGLLLVFRIKGGKPPMPQQGVSQPGV